MPSLGRSSAIKQRYRRHHSKFTRLNGESKRQVTLPRSAVDCKLRYLGHLTIQEDAVCKDEAAH